MFVVRGLLLPPFFVLGKIYKLCFGWLDTNVAKRYDEAFAREIQRHLTFLFKDHAAQIVPNAPERFPRSFDASYVTVAAEGLVFQFARCRGEFYVRVAPDFAPDEGEDLKLLLSVIMDSSDAKNDLSDCDYLRTLPRVLIPQLRILKTALSKDRYTTTLDKAVSKHNERVDQQFAMLQEKGITPKIL